MNLKFLRAFLSFLLFAKHFESIGHLSIFYNKQTSYIHRQFFVKHNFCYDLLWSHPLSSAGLFYFIAHPLSGISILYFIYFDLVHGHDFSVSGVILLAMTISQSHSFRFYDAFSWFLSLWRLLLQLPSLYHDLGSETSTTQYVFPSLSLLFLQFRPLSTLCRWIECLRKKKAEVFVLVFIF